jgi:hypothetical protein
MTTVGFGDVVPTTQQGKLIAGINAFAGLLLLGALVAVVALALQPTSWSTTLTSRADAKPPDQAEASKTEVVPHAVADVFDGLSKILRGTRGNDVVSLPNRVRVHVEGHGPGHVHIDVFVSVDAG